MSKKLQALLVEAGGNITGKVRFQKIVYLLDQLGFKAVLISSIIIMAHILKICQIH